LSISARKETPRPHQNVEPDQLLLLAAKRFPDEAPHVASIHGATSDSLADHDAEARERTAISHGMDHKPLTTYIARAQKRIE
jgi:hypothetical protein